MKSTLHLSVKVFLFTLICWPLIVNTCKAQPGDWTWVHGSNTGGSLGSYGVQGVPSPTNDAPSFYEACEWTDLNGNFWLFGGYSNGNRFSDLWKYDPLTNEWTWMKGNGIGGIGAAGSFGTQGVPSLTNNPPARSNGIPTWTDLSGDLWLFGGIDANSFNGFGDMWRYHIATNEWTWIKGPNTPGNIGIYGTQGVANINNNPSGRWETAGSWTDNAGDLWLFGGHDATGLNNDLWKYNIAGNTWTWIKGSNTNNQPGVYGILGVAAAANTPGARMPFCRWKDANGKLWLWGGGDYITNVYNNDLWQFDEATTNWTWMSGSNFLGASNVWGTKCVTDSTNVPGARFENRTCWTDQNGNLWFFGGAQGGGLNLAWNDLWMYCTSNNQWTWMSGDNALNPLGNWGTMGVTNATNVPSGRGGSNGWMDINGHIYVFGGWGNGVFLNDMWQFNIDPNCGVCAPIAPPVVAFSVNDTVTCSGTCANFTDLSTNQPTSWSWSFPGGTPSASTVKNPQQICYPVPGIYPVTLVATNAIGSGTATVTNFITVNSSPQINLGNDSTLCSNNPVILNAGSGYTSYNWNTGSTDSTISVTQPGDYFVIATNQYGCTGIDYIYFAAGTPPPVTLNDTSFCAGDSVTLNAGSGFASYLWNTGATTSAITVSVSGIYSVVISNSAGCTNSAFANITVALPPVINLGNNTSICSGDSITLNAGSGSSSYLWSTAATTSTITVSQSGTYSVTVTNSTGCSNSAQVSITVVPLPIVNLGNDSSFCTGGSVTLDAGNGFSSYLWNNGITTQTISTNQSGTYSVTVTNSTGCTGSDQIIITANNLPVVTLGNDTSICAGTLATLNPGNGFNSYAWSTGASSQTIDVSQSGTYSVTVTNAGNCSGSSQVNVIVNPHPTVNLGNDTVVCNIQSNPITLNAGSGFASYQWQDGSTSQTLNIQDYGVFTATVTDQHGCKGSDAINVTEQCESTIYIPNVFTPNGDNFNDVFIPTVSDIKTFSIIIYNRWGDKLFESNSAFTGWDGNVNGSPCPAGTYFYIADYSGFFGTAISTKQATGSITLIR